MEAWKYGALEARGRCSDVEAWRHGALKPWSRAEGVQTWRCGLREMRCRHVDVYGSLELGRNAAGVATGRYRGLEARCSVATWSHELWRRVAGMQPWRYGALSARCRCSDVEARRHGGMELWSPRGALRYGLLEMRCKHVDVYG